jgi:predicted ArsR family transcriptional regulator
MKPNMQRRVLRALEEGVEAAPELSDALWINVDEAAALLEELRAQGAIEREAKPTYRGRGKGGAHFRYRLAHASVE